MSNSRSNLSKAYTRINWQNEPSTNTPINETNLNAMDEALDEIDDRVIELDGKVATLAGYETEAEASAKEAQSYAKGGTGSRSGEDTDNAKYYAEQARSFAPAGYDALVQNVNALSAKIGNLSLVALSQSDYEALSTKDPNTLYFTYE